MARDFTIQILMVEQKKLFSDEVPISFSESPPGIEYLYTAGILKNIVIS